MAETLVGSSADDFWSEGEKLRRAVEIDAIEMLNRRSMAPCIGSEALFASVFDISQDVGVPPMLRAEPYRRLPPNLN